MLVDTGATVPQYSYFFLFSTLTIIYYFVYRGNLAGEHPYVRAPDRSESVTCQSTLLSAIATLLTAGGCSVNVCKQISV